MFWGACCEDISVQRPYLIWESETEEESRRAALSLKQENEQLKQEALQHRENSQKDGTEESRVLAEINANITRYNEHEKAMGHTSNKGKRRLKRPEQIWKVEVRERGEKHYGIDWFIYREKVRINALYFSIITKECEDSTPSALSLLRGRAKGKS